MTQQDFFLQAAIQIAAAMNAASIRVNGRTTPEIRKKLAECAANGATDLLVEVQAQWELGTDYEKYGALFDTDPQQEQGNDNDYWMLIDFGGNRMLSRSIIADNDMQAIEKAMCIFERALVKQGAKHYSLKHGYCTIKEV